MRTHVILLIVFAHFFKVHGCAIGNLMQNIIYIYRLIITSFVPSSRIHKSFLTKYKTSA